MNAEELENLILDQANASKKILADMERAALVLRQSQTGIAASLREAVERSIAQEMGKYAAAHENALRAFKADSERVIWRVGIAAALALAVLIGAMGYAAWTFRDAVGQARGTLDDAAARVAAPRKAAPKPAPAAAPPAAAPATKPERNPNDAP